MTKASKPKRVLSFVFSEAGLQAFWTYGFPPLSGLATAAAGVVERQPIMWVIAATSIAFAMTSLGLLAFGQWRFRRSAEHKVVFARVMVNRGSERKKARAVLGFAMKSTADFPLEVVLTKLNTSVAARIPSASSNVPRTLKVDAGAEFYFTGPFIDLTGVTDDPLLGEIEFEFQYGRPGGPKYSVSKAQVLTIPADLKKPFLFSAKLLPNEQLGLTDGGN